MYSGDSTSCYSNPEVSRIVKNLSVHLNMWPIQLQDMVNISQISMKILTHNFYLQVDEIVYYLQGIQSDVYKTAATLLNNHTKFIIIPEVSQL